MRTGDVVDGRYAILERAGIGGVGSVYRAFDRQTQSLVAVKVLHVPHATAQARFLTEARALAGLEHPHIVPLYDYWREPGVAYLVMRLLRGGSLRERLACGPVPLDQITRLIEQLAAALLTAHRAGVIHRDLKASNVLLDE
ncbi:MAG TPA: serine/threonine-protein kinase, partial [Polyangium sp.]|nr:serine/threonine-protein kinase [Polyangium sp.]